MPFYTAINDGRWKYIRYLKQGETEELYDLLADPEELVNLADELSQKAHLERLREALLTELRRTRAGFAEEVPVSKQMLGE